MPEIRLQLASHKSALLALETASSCGELSVVPTSSALTHTFVFHVDCDFVDPLLPVAPV